MEIETLSTGDINELTLEAPAESEVMEESEFQGYDADFSFDVQDETGIEEGGVSDQALESLFEKYFSEDDTLVDSSESLVLAAPSRSGRISFGSDDLLYRLEIGESEYSVLFPSDARYSLAVNNGYLINLSSSNITGVVLLSDDELSISDYHQKFYTLYPVSQTTAQNNLYRYHASGYLTTYAPSSGNNLATTLSYSNAEVIERPGLFSGYQQYQLIVMSALALLIVIQFVNGLFRR